MRNIQQTPGSFLDYTLDYSDSLGTDTIVNSSWAASSPDVTLSQSTFTADTTTIWITGGVPANIYTITNTATTFSGRIMQDTLTYNCVAQMTLLET